MTIDNGGETVNLIHVDFDDDFDDSYYEQAAEQIYDNGGYNPEMLSTQKGSALINETFRVFNTAIDKGLGEEPDPAVSAALRENAFIFSGFKTHAELEQVSQMLVDEKGNIKPFNEFLNDIQSINKDYNHNYLRTEYNQALQAAQMAGKWADFEKNKDFINLQYRTANDERVRASHRILHGTTLPVDDPFWKQYTPPNGWGCRCTVVAVLKDDYPVQDSHGSIAKAESCFKTPKEKMFKENLAEKKRLFPSKHPYLPKQNCNGCDLKGEIELSANGKLNCPYRRACKSICEAKKDVLKPITKPEEQKKNVNNRITQRMQNSLRNFKNKIPKKGGLIYHSDHFIVNHKICILNSSIKGILGHRIISNDLKSWLIHFKFPSSLKNLVYEGWKYCESDENGDQKHTDCHCFTYYSVSIKGNKYWVNVKWTKEYGEVIYCILDEEPKKLKLGFPLSE